MDTSKTISRRAFLGTSAMAGAGFLGAGALAGCSSGTTASSGGQGGTLNVTYWPGVTTALEPIFTSFTRETGIKVNYQPEPGTYPDIVTKFTTVLSAGSSAFDVLWIDDIMTASFGAAGWLLPLDKMVPKATIDAVSAGHLKLSSYKGSLYRIPVNTSFYVQFYRQDHLRAAGLDVPRTWADYLKVGRALTKGGNYGVGLVGAEWDDYIFWLPQAGGSFVNLELPGSQQALEFLHEMVSVYKIVPPTFPTDLINNLDTYYESGYISLQTSWPQVESFVSDKALMSKDGLGVAPVCTGPKSDVTCFSDWGCSISKFSPRQEEAARFIAHISTKASELTQAKTLQQLPARTDTLQDSFSYLEGGSFYRSALADFNGIPRPLSPEAQLLWKELTPILTDYVSGNTSLRTAVSSGQVLVKKYS
jgi:ABC-type glycerol-3-phosphate transport system substrate-binding protein